MTYFCCLNKKYNPEFLLNEFFSLSVGMKEFFSLSKKFMKNFSQVFDTKFYFFEFFSC